MKQLFHSKLWPLMLVLFALVSSSAASWADDLGELQLNTDYPLSDFKSYEGYFVAPSSGKLTYADMLTPYSDAAHENPIEGNWEGYSNGVSTSSIQVTSGTTYYFYADFLWSGGNFRLEMDKPFGIDFRNLEEGGKLFCSGLGRLEVKMSDKPVYTGVTFKCNGQEWDWTGITKVLQEKYLVVSFASTLLSIIEVNPELCGKNCQVVFSGLAVDGDASKLYNGDGVLTMNFVVGPIPTKLVSENVSTATMDSWFRPSEEKGLFTFNFSKPIQSGSIVLGYGNPESDSYYNEEPEMTINGSTVTVDLRGYQRRLDEQTDASGNPCVFSFKLQSFLDEDGYYIYSTDQGSLGSISFSIPYNKITTNLTAEFDPTPGSELGSAGQVEIYFSPAENVLFDDVKFVWDGEPAGITVSHDDLVIEYDNYGGCSVKADVPAAAKSPRNVTVSLTGLDTPDGLAEDYLEYVKAVFNTGEAPVFSLSLVSPADGSSLPGLVKEESMIKVLALNVPEADEIEMTARIYAPEVEDPVYTCNLWAATPADGETDVYNYAQTIYEDIDFLQGNDYTINITANKITYPAEGGRVEELLASNDYTVHGTGQAYVYSDAALVEIDPNPVTTDIISTDQNLITLTFDAPVTVTKAGTPGGLGSGLIKWTAAKADNDGKQWTVQIPTTTIENAKSSIEVSVWAVDEQQHPLYKTTVEGISEPTKNKENTYYSFSYNCTVGAPDFVVDPENGSELEVLDKIYVSYATGINPSYTTSEHIILYKGKGNDQEKLQEWTSDYFDMFNDDICVDYSDENNFKWCIALDEAVSEPGTYTFVFPNGFFTLGNQYDQANSRITNVVYTIPAPESPDNVETDPEVGSVVKSLKVIKVTWVDAKDAGVDYNVTDPVVLYDENKAEVCKATIDMSEDFDDPWNMLVVTLEQEVVTDGVYTLHIPAGKVLLNDGAKSSSEQNLSYSVVADTSAVNGIEAAEAGIYNVYNLQGVLVMSTANAADLKTLPSAIYIVNGRKLNLKN